jgi:hypothetical protein
VTLTVAGVKGGANAEVIDEGCTLKVRDGVFRDTFGPWDAHRYIIKAE